MNAQATSWAGRRGEVYVIAQLAVMALVAFGSRGWNGLPDWPPFVAQVASIAGVGLITAGVALGLSGIAALGHNLAAVPRPKPGATLVERGPYRYVRHPMYAGAALAAFGWALSVHGWLTLAYAAALVVFFDVKARREEEWLRDEIPEYAAYQKRVRRLLPFVY